MSLSLLSACIWALIATFVALIPMRFQYVPGLTLLILAPVILIGIGIQHGVWLALAGLVGFVSMFRHPLRYLWRKATGAAS